ncbi:MAG: outer membrane lipoprotein-sorting protein [bacterium]
MKQALYVLTLAAVFAVSAYADPDSTKKIPDAHRVQEALWHNMVFQDFRLEGFMRTDKQLHPLVLSTRNREMIFEFPEEPLQVHVELTPEGSLVHRRKKKGNPWMAVTGEQRLERILDSDVAYEDLGVDFLRWKNVKPLGLDSIKTLEAWAYEAKPDKISRYAKARYWISSEYLAVLRVDAYNKKGQVVKRVEVNGVQRVEGTEFYVIKEMMICNIIPGRDVSKTKSYFEIHKVQKGSGIPN